MATWESLPFRSVQIIDANRRLKVGALGSRHKLPIRTSGRYVGAILDFDHPKAAALTTLMTAQMLQRGYLSAWDEVFPEPAKAIAEDDIAKRIGAPLKQIGFASLT